MAIGELVPGDEAVGVGFGPGHVAADDRLHIGGVDVLERARIVAKGQKVFGHGDLLGSRTRRHAPAHPRRFRPRGFYTRPKSDHSPAAASAARESLGRDEIQNTRAFIPRRAIPAGLHRTRPRTPDPWAPPGVRPAAKAADRDAAPGGMRQARRRWVPRVEQRSQRLDLAPTGAELELATAIHRDAPRLAPRVDRKQLLESSEAGRLDVHAARRHGQGLEIGDRVQDRVPGDAPHVRRQQVTQPALERRVLDPSLGQPLGDGAILFRIGPRPREKLRDTGP